MYGKSDVDEAFEWLIVIVSIVSAILSQYPEYFYTITPIPDRPASLKAAIAIVPPLVAVVFVWLVGELAGRDVVQATAKITAWLMTLDVTWSNLYSYFLGIVWSAWGIIPTNSMIMTAIGRATCVPPGAPSPADRRCATATARNEQRYTRTQPASKTLSLLGSL